MPLIFRLIRPLLMAAYHLLYHQLAWSYDLVAWLVSAGHWRSWVLATIPLLRGPRVLELGYGPGHLQIALVDSEMEVWGIDKSPQMTRQAVSRLMKVRENKKLFENQIVDNGYAHYTGYRIPRLIRADALGLPFANGSFDTVVATFPAPDIFEPQTLAEVRRTLAPRGQLVILLSVEITGRGLLLRIARWLLRLDGQPGDWRSSIAERFTAAGLTIETRWIEQADARLLYIFATPLAPPAL